MIPKVSIIVPVYNAGLYLKRCMDSILGQTMREIEVILVDDGSEDDSLQICDEYAGRDGRVRVIKRKKQGVSAARNQGIQIAVGKWIMFVDADDWLEDNAVEILYEKAIEFGCEIVCATSYEHEQEAGVVIRLDKEEQGVYAVERNLGLFIGAAIGCPMGRINMRTVWGKLYDKSIVSRDCRFPMTLERGEDNIFNLYAIRYADQIYVLDTPLYHYRKVRPGSIMSSPCPDQREFSERYYQEVYRFMEKFQLHKELQFYYRYSVIRDVIELSRRYGENVRDRKELREAASQISRLSEDPIHEEAIAMTAVTSLPGTKEKAALWLLKKQMYRTIILLFVCQSSLRRKKTMHRCAMFVLSKNGKR